MKKLRLMIIMVIVFIGWNVVFAGKPQTNANDLATMLVDKLNADVQLTDSQKTVIQKRLQKQISDIEDADKLNDSGQKLNKKKQVAEAYQSFLDSILTGTQREQLNQKYETRVKTSK